MTGPITSNVAWVLDESQTTSAVHECPVCGSSAYRKQLTRLQEVPAIDLLECGVCGAASASRIPLPEVLDRYYSKYAYDGGDTRSQITFHGAERLARHIWFGAARAGLAISGRLSLLDFGGGDGSVGIEVGRLYAPGRASVLVVDYERPKCAGPRERNVEMRWARSLEDEKGSFDLVVASAILEHIPRPEATIRRLIALMRSGGILYARTPYVAPMLKVLEGAGRLTGLPLSKMKSFGYPGHIHDMGPAFWSRIDKTFSLGVDVITTQPAIPQIAFSQRPVRSLASYIFKLPAQLEVLAGNPVPRWRYVGGWEAFLRKRSS